MDFEITTYEVSWGAAGLVFALGGAASLSAAFRGTGRSPGIVVLGAPFVAACLAMIGARAHAMLSSPAGVVDAIARGEVLELALAARQRIAGGLLLATAFLLWGVPPLARRLSRRRIRGLEVLDAIVPWAGLSIGVGRIGCFVGGCCFGIPSEVPWAVRYGHGSAAYWNHVAQGLIPDGVAGAASLPVHALSLYLGGAGVLAAGVAARARSRRPRPGVVFATFVASMAASRLVLEPLRETRFLDPVPAQTAIDVSLLVGALVFGVWLRHNRAGAHSARATANGSGPSRPGTPNRWIRRAPTPSPSS